MAKFINLIELWHRNEARIKVGIVSEIQNENEAYEEASQSLQLLLDAINLEIQGISGADSAVFRDDANNNSIAAVGSHKIKMKALGETIAEGVNQTHPLILRDDLEKYFSGTPKIMFLTHASRRNPDDEWYGRSSASTGIVGIFMAGDDPPNISESLQDQKGASSTKLSDFEVIDLDKVHKWLETPVVARTGEQKPSAQELFYYALASVVQLHRLDRIFTPSTRNPYPSWFERGDLYEFSSNFNELQKIAGTIQEISSSHPLATYAGQDPDNINWEDFDLPEPARRKKPNMTWAQAIRKAMDL